MRFAVSVQDVAGVDRSAAVLYASGDQVNFVVPTATAAGPGTITVTTVDGRQLSAPVLIQTVAPSLFTVAAGIAAAYAVQVAPDGTQTIEPVSAPLSLNQPGQVYLTLFGTGFDAASRLPAAATVQGVSVSVTDAGPQGTAGLDQVNLLLPTSLAGTGVAAVSVTIGGAMANTVYITIQ